MRGVISPIIQYPDEPLKTDMLKTPILILCDVSLEVNRVPATWGSATLVVGAYGRPVAPYTIETAFVPPAALFPAYRKGSASTTCGTTTRRS
jgi:hypothetical protein